MLGLDGVEKGVECVFPRTHDQHCAHSPICLLRYDIAVYPGISLNAIFALNILLLHTQRRLSDLLTTICAKSSAATAQRNILQGEYLCVPMRPQSACFERRPRPQPRPQMAFGPPRSGAGVIRSKDDRGIAGPATVLPWKGLVDKRRHLTDSLT